jgi:hypothetical protein
MGSERIVVKYFEVVILHAGCSLEMDIVGKWEVI